MEIVLIDSVLTSLLGLTVQQRLETVTSMQNVLIKENVTELLENVHVLKVMKAKDAGASLVLINALDMELVNMLKISNSDNLTMIIMMGQHMIRWV